MFSWKYYEIFNNTFFYSTPPVAASAQIFEHGTTVFQKYSNHILFLPKLIWSEETSMFEVQKQPPDVFYENMIIIIWAMIQKDNFYEQH